MADFHDQARQVLLDYVLMTEGVVKASEDLKKGLIAMFDKQGEPELRVNWTYDRKAARNAIVQPSTVTASALTEQLLEAIAMHPSYPSWLTRFEKIQKMLPDFWMEAQVNLPPPGPLTATIAEMTPHDKRFMKSLRIAPDSSSGLGKTTNPGRTSPR